MVYRYPQINPKEVIAEAVARAMDGTRRWPQGVLFDAFFYNVMKSIAHGFRKAEKFPSVFREGDLPPHDNGEPRSLAEFIPVRNIDPVEKLHINEIVGEIQTHFAADDDVQALLIGLEEGMTGKEAQEAFDLSENAYGAARKRLERFLAKRFSDGIDL